MKVGKITSVNYNQFKVKVASDIRGNSVNVSGVVYYFGNIGSYLKTSNAVGEILVCEVISIFDSDSTKQDHEFDLEGNRELLLKPIGTINRDDEFELGVGIFPSLYSDVSIVTFDDMKVILHTDDSDDENVHSSFYLGKSKNLINYPVDINIDRFFNIHSAVLGNSGSGKSNTIAHIIQNIHQKTNYGAIGSKILIFDVNGEYRNAFSDHSRDESIKVELYKPNIVSESEGNKPFYLPHFLLNLDEWSSFLLATEATQRPFWDRVLQESYRFYKIGTAGDKDKPMFASYIRHKICGMVYSVLNQAESDTVNITAAASVIANLRSIIEEDAQLSESFREQGVLDDLETLSASCTLNYGQNQQALESATEEVYKKVDLGHYQTVLNYRLPYGEHFDYKFLRLSANMTLLEEDARGNKRLREYTSTLMTRLDYFLENSDCEFMRSSFGDAKSEADYVENLWSNSDENEGKTHLVIIDTSELGNDALETLTSVVSRVLFSSRKKLVGDKRRKYPVHLVLDEAHRYIKKDYQYILRENVFERIAREGRKYSLFLLVSSQRPSELSETVLSQCANFVVHRIQNEVDMRYVNAILPYFSEDLTSKIKLSVPGEALVFGNCVTMPMHVKVQLAKPEPNSKNCNIPEEWFLPNN